MQINQFPEVMSSCRFCFMCRHLSAVGQVSGRESDTPRGRALIADRVRMHPEEIGNADFIEAIYRSDLSGANRPTSSRRSTVRTSPVRTVSTAMATTTARGTTRSVCSSLCAAISSMPDTRRKR